MQVHLIGNKNTQTYFHIATLLFSSCDTSLCLTAPTHKMGNHPTQTEGRDTSSKAAGTGPGTQGMLSS